MTQRSHADALVCERMLLSFQHTSQIGDATWVLVSPTALVQPPLQALMTAAVPCSLMVRTLPLDATPVSLRRYATCNALFLCSSSLQRPLLAIISVCPASLPPRDVYKRQPHTPNYAFTAQVPRAASVRELLT
jgi:hypothetical protein